MGLRIRESFVRCILPVAVLLHLQPILLAQESAAKPATQETATTETVEKSDKKTVQKPLNPIYLAGKHLKLIPPGGWLKKKPRTRIVQHEFAVPKVKDDPADGRITIMGAGGRVEQNISRWLGQFKQADGTPTKDRAKISKKEIAKQTVHFADISGTFFDRPRGPLGPAIERKNYRMIGAIIVTKEKGQYFVKMYGPAKTMAAAAPSFNKFIESLEVGATK